MAQSSVVSARLALGGDDGGPPLPHRIGPFSIYAHLGSGRDGTVYLGSAPVESAWVAVKHVPTSATEAGARAPMLLDEATLAGRVTHPNLARGAGSGADRDGIWYAQEYLHGEPLTVVLRAIEHRGAPRPSFRAAARIIADAALGLEAAHATPAPDGRPLGLVHRRVGPDTLFVTHEGATRVSDLGVGLLSLGLVRQRGKPPSGLPHRDRTSLASVLGYMAPEQVRGVAIDRRTDVFALGALLWELAAGCPLFRREKDIDTLFALETPAPPPSRFDPRCPPELERAIATALAPAPADRFQTARELATALGEAAGACEIDAAVEVARYVQAFDPERFRRRVALLRCADALRRGGAGGPETWS